MEVSSGLPTPDPALERHSVNPRSKKPPIVWEKGDGPHGHGIPASNFYSIGSGTLTIRQVANYQNHQNITLQRTICYYPQSDRRVKQDASGRLCIEAPLLTLARRGDV
jgi:hypothetical protein